MKSESEISKEYIGLTNRIIDFSGYYVYFVGDYFIVDTPIGEISTRFNTIREIHCFLSGIDHQRMVSALKKG